MQLDIRMKLDTMTFIQKAFIHTITLGNYVCIFSSVKNQFSLTGRTPGTQELIVEIEVDGYIDDTGAYRQIKTLADVPAADVQVSYLLTPFAKALDIKTVWSKKEIG